MKWGVKLPNALLYQTLFIYIPALSYTLSSIQKVAICNRLVDWSDFFCWDRFVFEKKTLGSTATKCEKPILEKQAMI